MFLNNLCPEFLFLMSINKRSCHFQNPYLNMTMCGVYKFCSTLAGAYFTKEIPIGTETVSI